jgi:hypothetical protein
MFGSIVVMFAALLGPPSSEAPKPDPAKSDADLTEALAAYNGMRARSPQTAASQWALALWCEKHGLRAEAVAHLSAVVKLDPTRDAAWRKLGFKKRNGRWLSDEDIAEESEQKKADKHWAPRLKKIHKEIHKKKSSAGARETLLAIDDPRAVPAVYREFGGGGATDQAIASEALSHLASPLSSRLLALLSVYGKSPEVRRRSAETLRGRPPSEFLDVLAALMADPVKYEVRPVGGPGSPGVLFVEGKRYNTRRVYAAPPPPNITPMPGDLVTYDAFGMPVIQRPAGVVLGRQHLTGTTRTGGLDETTEEVEVYSATQALAESQRAAASSQARLETDVAELEALNKQRKDFNELVMAAARGATGTNPGDTPDDWRRLASGKKNSPPAGSPDPVRPTLDELVPPDYQPRFAQLAVVNQISARAPDN